MNRDELVELYDRVKQEFQHGKQFLFDSLDVSIQKILLDMHEPDTGRRLIHATLESDSLRLFNRILRSMPKYTRDITYSDIDPEQEYSRYLPIPPDNYNNSLLHYVAKKDDPMYFVSLITVQYEYIFDSYRSLVVRKYQIDHRHIFLQRNINKFTPHMIAALNNNVSMFHRIVSFMELNPQINQNEIFTPEVLRSARYALYGETRNLHPELTINMIRYLEIKIEGGISKRDYGSRFEIYDPPKPDDYYVDLFEGTGASRRLIEMEFPDSGD